MGERATRVRGYGARDKISPSFWQLEDGSWMIFLPDARVGVFDGLLGGLKNHNIQEHEDGTITVTPSILITNGGDKITRHGFLTRGVWSEC